jgi:hypothetical protein
MILLFPPNEEEEKREKIRGMKITLSGIENAFAQGFQRVSTIEKYEKNIELDRNESIGNNDNNTTIPFEFEIPHPSFFTHPSLYLFIIILYEV